MKSNYLIILAAMMCIPVTGYTQDSSFGMHVLTNSSSDTLYYDMEVKCTPGELKADAELKSHDKKKCTNGKKTIRSKVASIQGRANIYVDSKDRSKLRINYWLFYPSKIFKIIPSTRSEPESNEEDGCIWKDYSVAMAMNTLRTSKNDCERYFANEVIRETDFYVQLKNRQFRQFKFRSWNTTIMTLPVKYYFPVKESQVLVPSRASAAVNGNLYFNGRIGRAKYVYERNSDNKAYVKWQLSGGALVGFSVREINSSNTLIRQAAGDTLTSRFAPVFTIGGGITYGFREFTFGVFGGLDYAIGSDRDYWDYQGRPWIGFGISVSSLLSVF